MRPLGHRHADPFYNAKKFGLPIWQGKFVEAWNWRRGEVPEEAELNNAHDCVIEGNISGSERRIYLTPSSHGMIVRRLILQKASVGFVVSKGLQHLYGDHQDEKFSEMFIYSINLFCLIS